MHNPSALKGIYLSNQPSSEPPAYHVSVAEAREMKLAGTHYFINHGKDLRAVSQFREQPDQRDRKDVRPKLRDISGVMPVADETGMPTRLTEAIIQGEKWALAALRSWSLPLCCVAVQQKSQTKQYTL